MEATRNSQQNVTESPFKRRRRRTMPMALILLMAIFGSAGGILFQEDESASGGSTRCFCDKQSCGGGALVCAGKLCLIGVRAADGENGDEDAGTGTSGGGGRLDQHCVEPGSAESGDGDGGLVRGCARDWRRWSEVCVCEEHLCNTWAFLRARMESLDMAANNRHQTSRSGGAVERSLYDQRHRDPYDEDDDANGLGDDAMPGGHPYHRSSNSLAGPDPNPRRRGPALVLLLVVLPLAVGAFTVFLVFLNYHCKML